MVIGSPCAFFWRNVVVVAFLRWGAPVLMTVAVVKTGAIVDMVSSDKR
jgi:hypothetical protein